MATAKVLFPWPLVVRHLWLFCEHEKFPRWRGWNVRRSSTPPFQHGAGGGLKVAPPHHLVVVNEAGLVVKNLLKASNTACAAGERLFIAPDLP